MEPREDAHCVNTGSVQHGRHRMLQVGEEIQDDKEQENEQGALREGRAFKDGGRLSVPGCPP